MRKTLHSYTACATAPTQGRDSLRLSIGVGAADERRAAGQAQRFAEIAVDAEQAFDGRIAL
jgi:hypothetical protein